MSLGFNSGLHIFSLSVDVQGGIFGIPVQGLKVGMPKGGMWMVLSITGNYHKGSSVQYGMIWTSNIPFSSFNVSQRLSARLVEKVTGWFSCKAMQKSEGRAKTDSPCIFGHETPYITLQAQITIGGGGA